MNSFGKNLALWIIIILLVMLLFNLFQNSNRGSAQQQINYSDFLTDVANKQVRSVTIQGNTITGVREGGSTFTTNAPPNDPDLWKALKENKVQSKSHLVSASLTAITG